MKSFSRFPSVFFVLCALVLPCEYSAASARSIAPHIATTDRVFELIGDRVTLMRAVALDKWLRRLPIEDKKREAAVLQTAKTEAQRAGLANMAPLVLAQIEVAKAEQRRWFLKWDKHGLEPHTAAVDLARTRSEIDKLTKALVPAVWASLPALRDPNWQQTLKKNFDTRLAKLPASERALLWQGLMQIRYEPRSTRAVTPGSRSLSAARVAK